jgi:hypothetical protein
MRDHSTHRPAAAPQDVVSRRPQTPDQILNPSMRRVPVKPVSFVGRFAFLRSAQGKPPPCHRSGATRYRWRTAGGLRERILNRSCSQHYKRTQRFVDHVQALAASRSQERLAPPYLPSVPVPRRTEHPRLHARSLEAGLPSSGRFLAEPGCNNGDPHQRGRPRATCAGRIC